MSAWYLSGIWYKTFHIGTSICANKPTSRQRQWQRDHCALVSALFPHFQWTYANLSSGCLHHWVNELIWVHREEWTTKISDVYHYLWTHSRCVLSYPKWRQPDYSTLRILPNNLNICGSFKKHNQNQIVNVNIEKCHQQSSYLPSAEK